MAQQTTGSERVVIAIDPHKASWTAAAVNTALQPLASLRVPVSRDGYRQLRRFARRWPTVTWAIEGAGGLGEPLTTRLAADGVEVLDVPAKLAARVRVLSTGHGRKNDDADAISVGIAALSATGLQSSFVDEAITALRAVVDHRDDLVRSRTQIVNRLHVLLTKLVPAGAATNLSAEGAAAVLRTVRPRNIAAKTLRHLAVDLVSEVRHLDRRITATDAEIATALNHTGSTLTSLYGIGTGLAGKILARVGTVDRFRSAAAFASYTGTAPIEVSSGDVVRQLNHALHMMALTQIRHNTDGRAYYQRKREAGKSHKEAMRCLKRRLSDTVYRQLVRDSSPHQDGGPGGHSGAALSSSAAG